MSKLVKSVVALIATVFMIGCASNTPEMRAEKSEDKAMTAAFSKNLPKNEEMNQFIAKPDQIILNNYIDKEVGTSLSLREAVANYISHFDSSRDEIAKRYINVAKSRGNTVKMYNAKVNDFISRNTPSTAKLNYKGMKKYNLDNAFIEFDKNGIIVSMLVRKHVYPTIGQATSNYRVSQILFGKWSRIIQTRLNNNLLNSGYISTM